MQSFFKKWNEHSQRLTLKRKPSTHKVASKRIIRNDWIRFMERHVYLSSTNSQEQLWRRIHRNRNKI